MKKQMIGVVIAAVVLVGLSFYAGTKFSSAKSPMDFGGRQGMEMTGERNLSQKGGNGGVVSGEIIAKDDKSITVKFANGSSRVVYFSDLTQIVKTVLATSDDLVVGGNVIVNGDKSQDGTTTAQRIQLRANDDVDAVTVD